MGLETTPGSRGSTVLGMNLGRRADNMVGFGKDSKLSS